MRGDFQARYTADSSKPWAWNRATPATFENTTVRFTQQYSTDSQMSMQNDWMQQTRTRSDPDNTHTQDHNRMSNSIQVLELQRGVQ